MLVPQTRLIFWSGVIFIAGALIILLEPDSSVPVLAVVLLYLILITLDAARVYGTLNDVTAEFPENVRLTKDKDGEIEITLTATKGNVHRLRVGLALPSEIESPQEAVTTTLPNYGAPVTVAWPCTPRMRGHYPLTNIYLETASPFGFWTHHHTARAETQLHVYPNIQKEQKNLAAFFLNRGTAGIHAQRQVGKGRDFEQLREYIPGDSFQDIHWKATARRNHPVSKVFQIERTQEIYIIIDSSRLSGRLVTDPKDGQTTTQLERFINSAMVLGLIAQKQGDLFGLITFSNRVESFVRAKNGTAHFSTCRDALYTLEPKSVNPDFEELCSFVRLRLRKRALLFFLTNLDDPVLAESLVNNIDLLSKNHLVLVNMVTPPKVGPMFSDPNAVKTDDLYTRLGGHIEWQSLLQLRKVLHYHNVTMTLLTHENMGPELVSQYVNQKQRQLL